MNVVTSLRMLRWDGTNLYFGGLWVGETMLQTNGVRAGQWRAWVLTDVPGAHHGWYETEAEARRQVELVVRSALPPLVDFYRQTT